MRADERVKNLEARFVYFVTINSNLSRQDRARLDALLLSGDKPGKLSKAARHLYVMPRPGTISPWSSKATDIARACDIEAVERIERGICYGVKFAGSVCDEDVLALSRLLFDRMTEAVYDKGGKVKAMFAAQELRRSQLYRYRHKGAARWSLQTRISAWHSMTRKSTIS